jgi:hypothetical protein
MTTNFFHPSLLLLFLDPGSEIRDPGSGVGKNQDPGSGINIPDPPHCSQAIMTRAIAWCYCDHGDGHYVPVSSSSHLTLVYIVNIFPLANLQLGPPFLRWVPFGWSSFLPLTSPVQGRKVWKFFPSLVSFFQ